jgi:chemotaxis protein MotB
MKIHLICLSILLLGSCVSKKQYVEAQNRLKSLEGSISQVRNDCDKVKLDLSDAQAQVRAKDVELGAERTKIQNLEKQVDFLKNNNENLLKTMADLSVISKTGSENIQKTLQTLNEQSRYIKDLNSSIQRKDSLNMQLAVNIKRSLDNVNDKDINVEVRKGVVYISISDKLLFKSGSSDINAGAENVLSKIAKVVNDHKDFDILVEGHTDNVPMTSATLKDNWDLSAMRATSVVRYLQTRYKVAPERMTAGGRGEFVPKASNATAEGRSTNRRTEIIILPRLDEFFQLLEKQPEKKK